MIIMQVKIVACHILIVVIYVPRSLGRLKVSL